MSFATATACVAILSVPGTNSTLIPASTVFIDSENGQTYFSGPAVTITLGFAAPTVTAQVPGSNSNATLTDIFILQTPIVGVSSPITVTSILVQGLDASFAGLLSSLPRPMAERYQALYNFWLTIETNLENQLIARSTDQPINNYSFNAGEGSQSTSRMTLDELMVAIARSEGFARHYEQKLHGRGLMSHMLRRR